MSELKRHAAVLPPLKPLVWRDGLYRAARDLRREIQAPFEQRYGLDASLTRSQFEKSRITEAEEWAPGELGQTVLSPSKREADE